MGFSSRKYVLIFFKFSLMYLMTLLSLSSWQVHAQTIANGTRVEVTAKFKLKRGSGDFNTTVATAEVGDQAVIEGNVVVFQGDRWWNIRLDRLPSTPGYIRESFLRPISSTAGIASVSLTSPANGSSFVQGASVAISASAVAQAGTAVQRVEFFDGSSKLGEDFTSPYSMSVSNLSVGSHNLTAVAYAATGVSSTTAVISINVNNAAPTSSLAAFSNPTNGNVPFARSRRTDSDEERKLAFPSAEGVGKFADPDIGPGQNFKVMKVTNLNDSGAGSLRACVLSTGPRVCVFEVSGNIVVNSEMMAQGAGYGDLYIAGQTSPGGVQLISGPSNPKAPLRAQRIKDLVVRYLKLRAGDQHALSSDVDAIAVLGNATARDTHDIMLDHLSLQWSTDETAHFGGVANLTLQWSLQSEPLRCSACRDDRKTTHNYGIFADRALSITLYKNLLMGGYWRNPNVTAHEGAHLINNIAYDFGQFAGQFYVNHTTNSLANVVGNWYGYGPNTTSNSVMKSKPYCMFASFEGTPTTPLGFEFHLDGNVCAKDLSGTNNLVSSGGTLTSPILYQNGSLVTPSGSSQVLFSTPRAGGLSVSPASVQSASQALKDVLVHVGARADVFSNPRRDLVDQRAIDQLANCDVRTFSPQPVYNTAVPAPGYPNLSAGTTWSWVNNDTDQDGMLDSWELSHQGISTLGQLSANGDYDNDGWSDLEEFLNYLAGEHINWSGTGNPSRTPAANCGYP